MASDQDTFFKDQLYQQMLDFNAGSNTIMQTLAAEVGKKIISDGDTKGAVDSLKELSDVSKIMQLNTIQVMAEMKKVDGV